MLNDEYNVLIIQHGMLSIERLNVQYAMLNAMFIVFLLNLFVSALH